MESGKLELERLILISETGTYTEVVNEDELKDYEDLSSKNYIALGFTDKNKLIFKKNGESLAFHVFKKLTQIKIKNEETMALASQLKVFILKDFPRYIEIERKGEINIEWAKGMLDGSGLFDFDDLEEKFEFFKFQKMKNEFKALTNKSNEEKEHSKITSIQ